MLIWIWRNQSNSTFHQNISQSPLLNLFQKYSLKRKFKNNWLKHKIRPLCPDISAFILIISLLHIFLLNFSVYFLSFLFLLPHISNSFHLTSLCSMHSYFFPYFQIGSFSVNISLSINTFCVVLVAIPVIM